MTTLGLAFGVGAPAALASAPTTFCVHGSGYTCPSGSTDEGGNLQAALNAASSQPASSGSPNVVNIAPGSYAAGSGGFSYASSNPLRIVGAGADTTSLTAAAGATEVLLLGTTDTAETVSISGVAITGQTPNTSGLVLTGGAADHITVTSQQAGVDGVVLDGATLSSSVISDANSEAAVGTEGQPSELDDDTLDAGTYGVLAEVQTTIHRITDESVSYGVYASSVPVSIDDSLVKSDIALDSDDGGINALNDTLAGTPGSHVGVFAFAGTSGASYVGIQNSIIYAFPYSFETSTGNGGLAEINANSDNYDGLSYGSGISRAQSIGSDPGFVDALDGDYHLAFDSSLIDASSITTAGPNNSSTDLDGNPRVVVDGNASTPVDLGAYEYQHRAPVAVAAASVSSGGPGTVFSFDSTGSRDADDGDHLSYSWSFDDGASASGPTASHAFSTPGQHTATLTVTDSSGLTSAAAVTVTVTGPAGGNTGGGGTGTGTGGAGGAGGAGATGAAAGQQGTAQTGGAGAGGAAHGHPARIGGKVTIRISRHSIHGKSIKVTLVCGRGAPCSAINLTVTTTVHHHTITIGRLRLSLRRGQTRTLTLTLNRGGRALLASTRKLAITIAVSVRPAGAPAAKLTTAHATVTA